MKNLEEKCKAISNVFETGQWEFDSRFVAAAVVFKADYAEDIKEKLASIYEETFDYKSIKKAQKDIKKLAKMFFGVNKGQLLMISRVDDIILFGAWWPWGNEESITLRIGFYTDETILSDEKAEEYLKNWYPL
jgi:hypothetical protein